MSNPPSTPSPPVRRANTSNSTACVSSIPGASAWKRSRRWWIPYGRTPDLVSLDVEGLELDILRTIDFSKHRPHVFCIETLSYAGGDGSGVKNSAIHALMLENGYLLHAILTSIPFTSR